MYLNKGAITVLAIGLSMGIQTAYAGANDPLEGPIYDVPLTDNWAPSKYWGAGDKAGSANHMKDSKNVQEHLRP